MNYNNNVFLPCFTGFQTFSLKDCSCWHSWKRWDYLKTRTLTKVLPPPPGFQPHWQCLNPSKPCWREFSCSWLGRWRWRWRRGRWCSRQSPREINYTNDKWLVVLLAILKFCKDAVHLDSESGANGLLIQIIGYLVPIWKVPIYHWWIIKMMAKRKFSGSMLNAKDCNDESLPGGNLCGLWLWCSLHLSRHKLAWMNHRLYWANYWHYPLHNRIW